ncbi:MFS general substrate transporter [Hyaloscypha variabilis F]|uniref:MFS general substrate transporter n=1 Tax=Hyaloscypha variabilis (strain UAMH 11265 / GT02V1 / F) TaxID=1149755 RepID=A0A2J6S1X4_HYAVF|nr:MFS general substrate transporter [Hyaloscypha variabilis F]
MAELGGNHSRGQVVFVVTTATFVLASCFVAARLVSRFAILRSRTADDWFMIVAWFIAFGLSFAIDYGATKGLGRHDVDIPTSWLPALRKSEYAFTILYNPALMATKTSILIFYLRLSRNTQKLLRVASYVTLAIVNIAGVVLTFLNAFQCSPVKAAYDITQTNSNSTCISIVTLYLCSAPVNIITDLAILVLPIPVLTGMRLPQRQKTVLVVTFALGIFVTIVDVVRIYYLQQAADNAAIAQTRLGGGTDFAYNASIALMWSAVEVNVGIICACIPTLKPLIKRILPSMITDHTGASTEMEKEVSFSSQARNNSNEVPHRLDSIEIPTGIQPLPRAQVGGNSEQQMGMMDFLTTPADMGRGKKPQEMDMMDFLTTPDMDISMIKRSETRGTAATDNTVYFGFVNMRRPRSMLRTKGMESFRYCAIVTILFFLWGFSYGLLNTLNNQIGKIANQSTSQTLGLTTAYFGAYFFGALTVGQLVLRGWGFKATFICGLCIYGTGTLMFWPSAVLTSFPGFIISTFVVGFGLSVLETAANPFLALCGPSEHAEFRLLLAQGVQAVSSVLSQLLAEKVLFSSVASNPSLIDVQWTYLAVALFTVILALFFYYMPLPEASDTDLQQQSEDLGIYRSQTISFPFLKVGLPLIYTTLALAVFTQYTYVGAQEAMSAWFEVLLATTKQPPGGLTLTGDNYVLVGHSTFAVGRFLFAPLCLIIKPRILLTITILGCLIFSCLTFALGLNANGIAGPALVFFFFEGPVFPIVYAIGLRGLGRRTKLGAVLITAATSGGGAFQFVMWAVQQVDHKSVKYSFCVIVALFAFSLIFPIYLNLLPEARHQVDPQKSTGLPNSEGQSRRGSAWDDERPDTPIKRMSRKFNVIFSKIAPGGNDKGARESGEVGIVEHRERQSWGTAGTGERSP